MVQNITQQGNTFFSESLSGASNLLEHHEVLFAMFSNLLQSGKVWDFLSLLSGTTLPIYPCCHQPLYYQKEALMESHIYNKRPLSKLKNLVLTAAMKTHYLYKKL